MSPYDVLGVAPEADDGAIRKAYLELVRKFSPDGHPEKFKTISSAYESIKDEPSRLRHYLFNCDVPADSPLQTFVRYVLQCEERAPMSFDTLKDYLRKCAKT